MTTIYTTAKAFLNNNILYFLHIGSKYFDFNQNDNEYTTKMHLKDLFTKQCILGTIGICLAAFGAMFAVFWIEFFESKLAEVSTAHHKNIFMLSKQGF